MDAKKRVVILVILAVVLALIAILINGVDSNISTTRSVNAENSPGTGIVGIEVKPAPVEDKLAGTSGGVSK